MDDVRRSADPVERAHELEVDVLLAVSAHAVAGQSLMDFYSRLARTVGELVGADKVVFWRLGNDRLLTPLAGGHGVDKAFLDSLRATPCEPGGEDIASQVVYHDLVFRASREDRPAEFAHVLETLGVANASSVPNAISVPWRAGDIRLGLVAAYGSSRRGGFSREDTWVLQKAGLAAGLVTQLRHTQEELTKTVDRLTKVDGARQLLLKNMGSVAERERKRFVAELHDDALQKLTAAELQLARMSQDDKRDRASLETVRSLLDDTETSLRRLVFEVRPPALESPDGLEQSIRDRLTMLAAAGITHELAVNVPEDVSLELRTVIFRQVSEAVGNVERHSEATRVKVTLTTEEGGILGVIDDNGKGFVVAERTNIPGHLGLLALRERALMAGGRYRIESKPDSGTRVEFWIPLET